MSQNHGGRLARQSTSDKPGRPSLDRPSLFAGMDNEDSTFGGDTQRVRILSTLESTRRPSGRKGPMTIHGITRKKRSNWQTKALLGVMGIGVLTLLTSFVMVVADGHGPSAKPDDTNKPAPATPAARQVNGQAPKIAIDTSNPLAALIAQPSRPPPTTPAPQVAVIENVPPAPAAPMPAEPKVSKPVALASASVATTPARALPPKTTSITTPAPTGPVNSKPTATSLAQAQQPTTQGTAPTVLAGKRTPPNKSKDDDVALLEAMFAHTRPRPAVQSVADELKQRCGNLNGPDAATCRARVCVQNPTAAACHQD